MDNVLVTGGAGYVGSHVCKALAGRGYQPVTVDTLEKGHRWAVRWGPLATVDTRDEAGLAKVFQDYRPIGVMHFASYIEVGESVRRPLAYYHNNVEGIIALLSTMQRFDVQPFVFSSTAAVYGLPETVPIPETHPLRPISPYGTSKFAGERILFDLAATGAVRAVALRYFNAAGASSDGEIGEAHAPETHLIPNAMRAAYDPAFTLDLFGSDFDTRDGTAVRDFVHVEDLAAAHLAALTYLLSGGASRAFNLGTGTGASVREVMETCRAVLGQEPRYREAKRRVGDPPTLVADAAQAKEHLGWQAQQDLAAIIESARRWELGYRLGSKVRR